MIVGDVVLEDCEQLLQLLIRHMLLAIYYYLLEVIHSDIWLTLIQQHCYTTYIDSQIWFVLIKQGLCLVIRNIFAILIKRSCNSLIRDVLFVFCQLLLQLCDRYILLIAIKHILQLCNREAILTFLYEQLNLLVWNILLVLSQPLEQIINGDGLLRRCLSRYCERSIQSHYHWTCRREGHIYIYRYSIEVRNCD